MKSLLRIKLYLKAYWVKVCRPKTQSGFGIIEVMIAASLLMIIAAGMTALLGNMQKEQRRQTMMSVFASKKQQIQNAILNDSSWLNTMKSNASMSCLVSNDPCNTTYVDTVASTTYKTTYTGIVLKDGASSPVNGNEFYDGTLTGAASGTGKGFTETGAACSTFTTAAAGNDACPFGYRVSWAAQSGQSNPKVVVYAKLIYNPANKSFESFFNSPSTSTTINEKYDVKIERTAFSLAKTFSVGSAFVFGGGGSCSTAGYGTCSVGSWGIYGSLTELSDPYSMITILTGNTIQIDASGNYRCTMTSYAFGTNDASTRIFRLAPTNQEMLRAFSSANKATWGYANITVDGNIPITAAGTTLQLQHQCSTTPGGTGDPCALGYVSSPYPSAGSTVYRATLNCTQVVEK